MSIVTKFSENEFNRIAAEYVNQIPKIVRKFEDSKDAYYQGDKSVPLHQDLKQFIVAVEDRPSKVIYHRAPEIVALQPAAVDKKIASSVHNMAIDTQLALRDMAPRMLLMGRPDRNELNRLENVVDLIKKRHKPQGNSYWTASGFPPSKRRLG